MTFRVVLQVRIVYVSSQTDPTDSQSSPSRTVSGRVKARWGGEWWWWTAGLDIIGSLTVLNHRNVNAEGSRTVAEAPEVRRLHRTNRYMVRIQLAQRRVEICKASTGVPVRQVQMRRGAGCHACAIVADLLNQHAKSQYQRTEHSVQTNHRLHAGAMDSTYIVTQQSWAVFGRVYQAREGRPVAARISVG